jgi:N-acetyltransferase
MSKILTGHIVRLEPLDYQHAEGLARASMFDNGLYQWSPAEPFAIVRLHGQAVIGSSRIFNIERWAWKPAHPRHGREYPDAGEIGYTWLDNSAIRTGVNTEAKLLMLTLAFEKWQAFRICFHADNRNERSKAAIDRLGAKFEGILRSHRLAPDGIARDSARFSITAGDWPEVKQRLSKFLNRS